MKGNQLELAEGKSRRQLTVQVERGRTALRILAQSGEPTPSVVVQATFSGGPDGISLQVSQAGTRRAFSQEALVRHPALSAVLRLIADEIDVGKPASPALLGSLLESVLVYVGRIGTPVPLPRWGRPLRDLRVERALAILSDDIAQRWTVELLARKVGMSRSSFAREFQRNLGLSPMRYLTQRRLQLAAALLLGTEAGLAEIALRVGYQSEFALSRAFKRHHLVPPGVFRQKTAPPRAYAMAA